MQGHMWSGLVKDNPVERVNAGHPELDPSRSFKFGQLEAFNKLKAEKKAEGKEVSGDEIFRPRVLLEACLASFSAPEEVHGFYSTALKTKTTAVKTAGLTSFPDYLVLRMRKLVMEKGWVPKKLDVYIDVPDIIDISHMRSRGIQPGEELLPEADVITVHVNSSCFRPVLLWISWTRVFAYGSSSLELGNLGWQGVVDEGKVESEKLLANEEIVAQLVSMGFNHLHCQKAAINTSNAGVEEAIIGCYHTWMIQVSQIKQSQQIFALAEGKYLESSCLEDYIDVPISQEAENAEALSFVDQSKVDTLISFGFQEDISRKALRASGGDIENISDNDNYNDHSNIQENSTHVLLDPMDVSSNAFATFNLPTKVISIKFDGTNFLAWSAQLIPLFWSYVLMGTVDGSNPCLPQHSSGELCDQGVLNSAYALNSRFAGPSTS
ncbi:Ubiquitin carboxyl-terminal hydrolase 14 [Vitis vinifera]|uniref:Ubiquitin carboxyl-terminal hydrolase 14 n=1 Tax=Vitis vinifera TaxID=29760 RepID=A0A438GDR2_VITVI|nr:Ubiquitin carboxyl-terminal hydrolase 14 [Vitis vinifera]